MPRPLSVHIVAIFLLSPVWLAQAEESSFSRGTAHAVHVKKGPAIDGTLSDPLWMKCPPWPLGDCISADPLTHRTMARVLFDETHMYVAVHCAEPDTENLKLKAKKRDGQVWADDAVEVFVQADPDREICHFLVNAAGVLADEHSGVKKDWDSSAEVKTSIVKNTCWIMTLRVPLKELGAYVGKNQRWLMNIFRSRQPHRKGEKLLEYSWSIMKSSNFHSPLEFGAVEGVNVPSREDGVTRSAEPPPPPFVERPLSPAAGVMDLKVTTDRSIDCSSLITMARDVFAGCKTEEEKAIKAWYFIRRMMYHHPQVPTWNTMDLINSYGWGICGHQSRAFVQLCDAGGLRARVITAPSHQMAEAWYDGSWHLYDCQIGLYALRRDKSAVAGYEEIQKDLGIVKEALKEGRGSKPYFQCSGGRDTRAAVTAIKGVDTFRMPKASKHQLVISLRRGESITRTWDNEGKAIVPAYHQCPPRTDRNDPVNLPFWEPYADRRGGIRRTYGNGRLIFEPDLKGPAFLRDVCGEMASGLEVGAQGAGLRPRQADVAGRLEWVVNSPYIAVDAWLDLSAFRKTEADQVTVFARGVLGRWRKVWSAEGVGSIQNKRINLKPFAWKSHRFFVKLDLKAKANKTDIGIDRLKQTTVFMNNKYALPYLLTGKNTVRVTAAEGADPKARKVTLEYAWVEKGELKKLIKRIDAFPFETVVEVAGEKHPRMKHLRLSVAP